MPKVDLKHKEKRINQILDAAFRCFSQHGYRDTSMRDILKESGLSAGAVYNYFKSKNEIVESLVIRSKKAATESLKNLSPSFTKSKPGNILDQYLSHIDDQEAFNFIRADISIWDAALNDKRLMNHVEDSFKFKLDLYSDILGRANNNPEANQLLAQVIISLVLGASLQSVLLKDFDLDSYRKFVVGIFEKE